MDNYSRYKLEHVFANNFNSPLFPVLANLYYEKEEYQRALKVCTIGLKNDSNNHLGKYILSKIYLKLKREIEAEKLLKDIVDNDVHNIDALLLLIDVKKKLKRSNITIIKYINYAENFIKNSSGQPRKTRKKKRTRTNPKTSFIINPDMATKTMYSLLIKQKKYHMARNILSAMAKQKKHKSFVNVEIKKIEKHITNKDKA